MPLLPPRAVAGLAGLRLTGPLFRQPLLTNLALAAVAPFGWFVTRIKAGLRLGAAGENPRAAAVTGTDPALARVFACVVGAAIAGLGGAVLVLQQAGTFIDAMTSGRGVLALAAVVGRWRPVSSVAACLVFGAAEALELRVAIFGLPFSSYTVQILPDLLAALAAFGRSARMPAPLGQPLAASSA